MHFPTDKTFHQFHDLNTEIDLHRIKSGFYWAFATDMSCQQWTRTLPDTWFRSSFWDLLMLQLLRTDFPNFLLDFSWFCLGRKYASFGLSAYCRNHIEGCRIWEQRTVSLPATFCQFFTPRQYKFSLNVLIWSIYEYISIFIGILLCW